MADIHEPIGPLDDGKRDDVVAGAWRVEQNWNIIFAPGGENGMKPSLSKTINWRRSTGGRNLGKQCSS
jgi:hypothetical protein